MKLRLNLKKKIIFLSVIGLFFSAFFIHCYLNFKLNAYFFNQEKLSEKKIFHTKKIFLKGVVDLAAHVSIEIFNKEKDLFAAKKKIIAYLSKIRFLSGSGYFFAYDIADMNKVLFAFHGVKPNLNNKVADITKGDIKGNKFREKLISIAQKSGSGFVKYYYQKPTTKEIIPKLAYSYYIKEINWVLISGIYIDDIEKEVSKMIDQNKEYKSEIIRDIILISVLIIVLISIVSIIYSNKIFNKFIQIILKLKGNAKDVNCSAISINDAGENLSQDSQKQASAVEEMSATMEELSSQATRNSEICKVVNKNVENLEKMIGQNAKDSFEVSQNVLETKKRVEEGVRVISEITTSMNEIKKGSEKITDIIDAINEIAQQTKMLAVNAAIEAARAGEHGQGFAVVADQVSKLAETSRSAAKEIADLIKESVKKSESGMSVSEKGTTAMNKILQETEKVGNLICNIDESNKSASAFSKKVKEEILEILSATQEQANGITQTSAALNNIDGITQKNAANAEETSSSSEELRQQSDDMLFVVEELDVFIKGGKFSKKEKKNKFNLSNNNSKGSTPTFSKTKSIGNKVREISPKVILPIEDDFEEF